MVFDNCLDSFITSEGSPLRAQNPRTLLDKFLHIRHFTSIIIKELSEFIDNCQPSTGDLCDGDSLKNVPFTDNLLNLIERIVVSSVDLFD